MKNGMRAITRQIRLKEWTEVFRDRAESGMLVKDYCDAHGITKDKLTKELVDAFVEKVILKPVHQVEIVWKFR